MKHHLLLKPSQSLQLDRLDPNVESTIMANKIEQMRQQLQMNGTSHSNSAAMSEDNKTAEMKKKQQLGKRYSGIWGGKWSYEEIEEKPEPPPNEFEYLGLRPRKMQQQLMPPPPVPKPKPNPKLMATKSIAPIPGEGTLKQSWSDSILANRRWSIENPEHLLKDQQQQPQFKAPAPPTTSTKMPAKLPGSKPHETRLTGPKPNEPKLQGPKPNEEEENVQQMKEKGQNEGNAGELMNNKEKEGGIIEKEQPVEPKKRGSPKGSAATNKKKKGTKGGRKTKKEEEKILAEGKDDEEEEKVTKRQYKPRAKRVYWEYVWEPVPEPVTKKPRKQGSKKNEEQKVVEEKLSDVAEQQLELEPKEQPKIEQKPNEAEQVQQNEPIVEAMEVEVSQKQQNELDEEEQPKEETIQIQKQRELPFVPMLEVIEENIVEVEEQHQKEAVVEREEDGEIRDEDLANEEEEKEEASFGSKEYVSETEMEEEEEEGVAKMNGMKDISNERRHIQQPEDEYEEEDDEFLPVIPVVGHPSSPPPPPQSSTSPSTPDSRANPNELDAELAMIVKPRPLHVDRDGYLTCRKNSIINDRFYVERELGDGVFSNVYLVLDRQDNAKKAMKIIRNTQEYMAAAEEEIEVLNYFDQEDPQKKEQLVIRILETFQVEPIDRFGHHCILLPLYGKDVFTFMKDNKYHPFPLEQIRYMAYQLIHATNFLHSIHLTHTDLKPENILFVNSTKFVYKKPWHKPLHPYDTDKDYKPGKKVKVLQDVSIRLCDMGSAVFDAQPTRDRCVSTRHYRAPEAILEIGWDHSCDVWSLGCIFFELYAGHFLIPQVDDLTHLTILEKVFGIDALPMWMRRLTKKPDLFNNRFKLLKRQKEERGWDIEDTKPLKSYIHEDHQGDPDHEALFDLIDQMLIHDPKMRVKLAIAQNHEFFNSLEPTLRAKVDRGGWDEDNDVQPRNHRNKIYPSKNRQPQNGNVAESGYHGNGNGGAGPSNK